VGYGSGGSPNKNNFQQFGAQWGNNDNFGDNDGWGQMGNQKQWGQVNNEGSGWSTGVQVATQGQGQRRVVSKSTSTKSQSCNGVTKIVKITKIKYSDGTEEEEREETINS
jgi:hypothetical protein